MLALLCIGALVQRANAQAIFTVNADNGTGVSSGNIDLDGDGTPDGTWSMNTFPYTADGTYSSPQTFTNGANALMTRIDGSPVPNGIGFDMGRGGSWDLHAEWSITITEPGITFVSTFYGGNADEDYTKYNHATSYTVSWTGGTGTAGYNDGTYVAGVPQIGTFVNGANSITFEQFQNPTGSVSMNTPVFTDASAAPVTAGRRTCVAGGKYWQNACAGWMVYPPPLGSTSAINVRNRNSAAYEGFRFGMASFADIKVEKSVSKPVLIQGETATFTIKVTNKDIVGNSAVVGLKLNDLLPAGLVCQSGTGSSTLIHPNNATYNDGSTGGTYDCATGEWDVGKLYLGDSAEMIITFKADHDFTGTVTNEISDADYRMAQIEQDLTDNAASADVMIIAADPKMELTKVADPMPADLVLNDTINYTFQLKNTGNITLTNVVIADSLLGTSTLACDQSTPATDFSVGEVLTCTATYTVTQDDIDNGAVNNTATATAVDICKKPTTATASEIVTGTQIPDITLNKSAIPTPTDLVLGAAINYTFVATNTGNVTLNNVVITDTMAGLSVLSCDNAVGDDFIPGEVLTCTASYTIQQSDIDGGAVTNTASASGKPPKGDPVVDTDSETVTGTPVPGLTLDKSAIPKPAELFLNDIINYTFVTTNTGNVTLNTVIITDTMAGLSVLACDQSMPADDFIPGEVLTCTATYTITQDDVDNETLVNSASVSGTPPDGGSTGDSDGETVPGEHKPGIELDKSATPMPTDLLLDDLLTYTFVTTNTGNVTLNNVIITDTMAGLSTLTCDQTLPVDDFKPKEVLTCTATYVVTQEDIDNGLISNNAIVGGTPPDGNPISGSDDEEITGTQVPAIKVDKSASPMPTDLVLDALINYTFVATNTGNVTLNSVIITDTMAGLSVPSCDQLVPADDFIPGEVLTCTATYMVTQADIDNGIVTNSATATGVPPGGGSTGDSDTEIINGTRTPDITLQKSANPMPTDLVLGAVINYTFVATNTGNTTLDNVVITDSMQGLSVPSCDQSMPADDFIPGEVLTCTASYTITQADVDNAAVLNSATASGDAPDGSSPSDDNGETVDGTPAPALEATKLADMSGLSTPVMAGDVITYTIIVDNTGNQTLSNITLNDTLTDGNGTTLALSSGPTYISGDGNVDSKLAVTETWTYQVFFVLTQSVIDSGGITNTVTASGDDPDGDTVSDKSDDGDDTDGNDEDDPTGFDLPADPELTMDKAATPNPTDLVLGDTITYTLIATNTGNVTLNSVNISDTMLGLTPLICSQPLPANDFAPNEVVVCTTTYVVKQSDVDNGSILNNATVSGTDPDGNPTSDSDGETVPGVPNPGIEATKLSDLSGLSSPVSAGDLITYTIVVDNVGNQTLSNIVLTDTLTDGNGAPLTLTTGPSYVSGDTNVDSDLAITETWTYQATYILPQSVIDSGGITNTVTASGDDPDGDTVSDESDDGDDSDGNDEDDPTSIDIPADPSIEVVKMADTSGLSNPVAAGDVIAYTFVVSNTGNVSLNNIVLNDTLTDANGVALTLSSGPTYTAGDLSGDSILDVTETWTYTATYALSQSAINSGGVSNSVTATGDDPNGDSTSDDSDDGDDTDGNDDDDPTETTLPPAPELELIKESFLDMTIVDDPARAEPGDVIFYTFSVTNTGNVDVYNITISDPVIGVVNGGPITLTVGANDSTTFSGSITLTSDIIASGGVTNTATASGTTPDGGTVNDTSDDPSDTDDGDDDPTFTDLEIDPEMIVEKSGQIMDLDGDGMIEAGETISYTFTITNSGNVDLFNITISDPLLTPPNGMIQGGPIPTLTVGMDDSMTFIGLYTIQPEDMAAGVIINTATAYGSDPNGDPVSGESDDPNDPSNDSDDDDDGNPDDPTSTSLPSMPSLELVKSATFNDDILADGEAVPGETVTYNFMITNTGNVSLTNITISDALLVAPNGALNGGPISLGPGQADSLSFVGTYTLTSDIIAAGGITNTATATGTAPDGSETSDESDDGDDTNGDDDPTTLPIDVRPELTLEKYGTWIDANSNGTAEVGETIVYAFTVRNSGNVDISNISITDPNVTVMGGPIVLLPVGAVDTTTFSAVYVLTSDDISAGGVTNQATATGTDPNGDPVEDESDDPTNTDDDDPTDTSLVPEPAIQLLKEATFNDLDGDGMADVGETITYSFTVRNTGNVDISNITITDTLVAVSGGPIAVLTPGAVDTTTFSAVYTLAQDDIVNGSVTNSATASGEDGNGAPIEDTSDDPEDADDEDTNGNGDPDDPTELPIEMEPSLTLQKIGTFNDENGDGGAQPGETISYQFIVENTGNVDLTNVVIIDTLVTINGSPITLLPIGAVDGSTFSAVYTLTSDDIAAGGVTNEATAIGTDPDSNIVEGDSDDPTDVDDEDSDGDGEPDDPTEVPLRPEPSLALTKVATFMDENGDGSAQPGETISYAFTITNTGNVDLTNVMITDPYVTSLSGGPIALLPVGAADSATFTAVYILTSGDIASGSMTNAAVASGDDPNGGTVIDHSDDPTDPTDDDSDDDGTPDDPTDVLFDTEPAIDLLKTSIFMDENGDGLAQVGETIVYNFVVENIGNVDLLNVTISDALVSVIGGPIPILPSGAIDSTTFQAAYTLTQDDVNAGGVTNTATAVGSDPNGNPVEDDSDDPSDPTDDDPDGDGNPDDPTETSLGRNPAINLLKVGTFNDENGDGTPQPGETIKYFFSVENVGNVDLSNVMVSDSMVTVTGGPLTLLAVGASDGSTFSAIYILTSADIAAGGVTNTATASGTDPSGNPTSDVSDDPNNPTNDDPNGDGNPDDPTWTPLTPKPSINLLKVGTFNDENGDGAPQAGESISYLFTVQNSGNVDLFNIVITDEKLQVAGGPLATLPVGATDSTTFSGLYILTPDDLSADNVSNTASVTGEDPNGEPVSDISDDPNIPEDADLNEDGNPDDPTVTDIGEPLASFTSYIWNDTDGDGIKKPDEVGLGGVTVDLYDLDGNLVGTTVTNPDGSFSFDVPAGDYSLYVRPLNGFEVTKQGTGDDFRSGADASGAWPLTVSPGENRPDIGAGLIARPTAIALIDFTTELRSNGTEFVIRWGTSAEIDTFGFHILRSSDGKLINARQVTNQFIPSQSVFGGRYEIVLPYDPAIDGLVDEVAFWLSESEVDGDIILYGPAQVGVASANQNSRSIYLPLINNK